MPIQEALVWRLEDCRAPGGVSFGPNSAAKEADAASWRLAQADLRKTLQGGDYVMAMIQTRRDREWDPERNQYAFKPAEDYLVAAYLVPEDLGKPYAPGLVSSGFVRMLVNLDRNDDPNLIPGVDWVFRLWQCSPKSVNLTTNGTVKMVIAYMSQGMPKAEALNTQISNTTNGQKYGWKGGAFPPIEAGWRRRA